MKKRNNSETHEYTYDNFKYEDPEREQSRKKNRGIIFFVIKFRNF
jgi:hypothetical protein